MSVLKMCPTKEVWVDCEKCGMFDDKAKQCSIKTIARSLDVITELLDSVTCKGQIITGTVQ